MTTDELVKTDLPSGIIRVDFNPFKNPSLVTFYQPGLLHEDPATRSFMATLRSIPGVDRASHHNYSIEVYLSPHHSRKQVLESLIKAVVEGLGLESIFDATFEVDDVKVGKSFMGHLTFVLTNLTNRYWEDAHALDITAAELELNTLTANLKLTRETRDVTNKDVVSWRKSVESARGQARRLTARHEKARWDESVTSDDLIALGGKLAEARHQLKVLRAGCATRTHQHGRVKRSIRGILSKIETATVALEKVQDVDCPEFEPVYSDGPEITEGVEAGEEPRAFTWINFLPDPVARSDESTEIDPELEGEGDETDALELEAVDTFELEEGLDPALQAGLALADMDGTPLDDDLVSVRGTAI